MARGRREQFSERKLNMKKVVFVIVFILAIIAIILTIKNKDKIFKKISSDEKGLTDSKIETGTKEKTIEEILAEFGGETIENPKSDTYIVKKEEKIYTIYSDGEIVEGKINIWNGESKEPVADEIGNYNIYSAEELKWIADKVIQGEKNFNGITITLRANIDLGGRQKEDGTWEGTNWTSIVGFLDEISNDNKNTNETQDSQKENLKRFAGCFNGNGFWIRGLYSNTENKYQGLFGYSSGTIQNLTLKNSYITGKEIVGGIAGLNGGNILNCTVENSIINGETKVGGICGVSMTSSTIKQCSTKLGKIIGKDYTGGICGYVNNNTTISESSNDTETVGENYVGGVCGISFFGTVLNTNSNNAKIEGKDFVGGILGYSQAEIEKNCNKGTISGKNHVSGLAGVNYTMGNIIKSYNLGEITGDSNVGGIAGTNNASISNCYNTGKIIANDYRAGGICGQNGTDSFIYTSYSIGKIEGNKEIDGISGGDFGTITNCYYLESSADVSNSSYKKSEEEMKNDIILDLGVEFVADNNNINQGYPILSWQQ